MHMLKQKDQDDVGYDLKWKNQDGESEVMKLIRSWIPESPIVIFFFNKRPLFYAFF
jgi:hypothetical protein